MPMTSSLSPSVVLTELDEVFYQEFNRETQMGYVDATSPKIFRQDSSEQSAETMETFKGVKAWGEKEKSGDIPEDSSRVDNQKVYTMLTFAKGIEVEKEYFDDDKHGTYERLVEDFARKARLGRDNNAFKVYNGAFDTYTTADGSYFIASDHTTLSGDTVNNKLTSALSESSLNDAILNLRLQKDQAGEVMGNQPAVLLVAPKNYKLACEILESEQKSGTADNDTNVYSSKYNIYIATSDRLASDTGGNDDAWFLIGENFGVFRWEREAISTYLRDWRETKNQNYYYAGRFREEVGAHDYVGITGSNPV